MITLTVNGKSRDLDGPTPLLELLRSSGVNLQFVAVCYNGEVLDREKFPQIVLNEGDQVEVVRPVGGG